MLFGYLVIDLHNGLIAAIITQLGTIFTSFYLRLLPCYQKALLPKA